MNHLGFVFLCVSITTIGLTAQEFGDHRLIGSYEGSEIVHQEQGVYHEYPVVTAYDEDGSVADTDLVLGRATMTLYDAPRDVSTFTVFETYRAFLENEGFTLLAQCAPGECPGDILEAVYFLMPFANNGNYGHPAPFTNGSSDQSGYLSAVKSANGQEVYVSLLVAAGWAAYPQYRLDVVETASNPGRIGSSDNDHPVVGRYLGANDFHQEASAFDEYTFVTGVEPQEPEITSTVTVQGETWMTLYDAPRETSTYTIYATYLAFLQQQGFTIVLDYKPGQASSDLLSTVYNLEPFADHGGYYHPAVFSNGNGAHAALISARRELAGSSLYVTLLIADGWSKNPQYRLDVVQVGSNPGSISSTGTIGPGSSGDGQPPAADSSGSRSAGSGSSADGFLTGNRGLRVIAGIGVLSLLDPAVAGILANTDQNGSLSAQSDGFRNNAGPFAEVAWFPNANFGIGLGVSQFSSDEGFTSGDDYFRSLFDMKLVRLVAITRMVGTDIPASINMSLTGGVSIVELQLIKEGSLESYIHEADDVFGVIGCTVEMTVPILRIIHFSAGIDVSYVPFTTFEITGVEGAPYTRTLHEGNLGGISLRLGLVGRFD